MRKNDIETFACPAIASQKHCPICAEVVIPSTNRCIRECVWPPAGTSLGPSGAIVEPCTSDAASRSGIDTQTLQALVDKLRGAADNLTKAMGRRESHAPSGNEIIAVDFRAFLCPAIGPKTAHTCGEIDEILRQNCGTDGKRLGFERMRRLRAIDGGKVANMWFYKFKFDGDASKFVAATNEASKPSPELGE